MPELRARFHAPSDWTGWWNTLERPGELAEAIVAAVRAHGLVEPFTGRRRLPHEIAIDPDNLHETISAHQLNARKRALLAQFQLELRTLNLLENGRLRTLSADGVSRVTQILRGRYPLLLAGEFLPTPEDRERLFPVPHLDLEDIGYPDASFDTFFCGDGFERVPDLDRALVEIARILRPGGLLVTAFPFAPNRETTLVKATVSKDGTIRHHGAPEYTGTPSDANARLLVYSYPGWDILDRLRAAGFGDARFNFIGSSRFGICGNGLPGAFVLSANKVRPDAAQALPAPRPLAFRGEWPEAVYALLGLPRSGTTLLTSLFAVHSRFEAVYEPWNAKALPVEERPTLEDLMRAARLRDLSGKALFVKETTADLRFSERLRQLYFGLPHPIGRRFLVILRRPVSTFLSEYRRRNEWWGDKVVLDAEFLRRWCQRSRESIKTFMAFAAATGGTFIALESLADAPEAVLQAIAARTGFMVEERQLAYEQHVDRRQVRGDLNISQEPKAISPEATAADAALVARVEALAGGAGAEQAFLAALERFHAALVSAGGVLSWDELDRSVVEPLRG